MAKLPPSPEGPALWRAGPCVSSLVLHCSAERLLLCSFPGLSQPNWVPLQVTPTLHRRLSVMSPGVQVHGHYFPPVEPWGSYGKIPWLPRLTQHSGTYSRLGDPLTPITFSWCNWRKNPEVSLSRKQYLSRAHPRS